MHNSLRKLLGSTIQCSGLSTIRYSPTYTVLVLCYAVVQSNHQPQAFTTFAYSTSKMNNYYVPRLHPPKLPEIQQDFGIKAQRRRGVYLTRRKMSLRSEVTNSSFHRGDKIQVEVVKFGPLGASVDVISHNSHNEKDLIAENEVPLGYGLILQKEIKYFRAARNGVDVVAGEILPAYVEHVRPEDGKLNIALRVPGMKAKADDLAEVVLARCRESYNGEIDVGDKSTPEQINDAFPGASKASFKRAVSTLYKKRLVQPGKHSTRLTSEAD